MCQCIFCEEEIVDGQYALIGGQPMHESCVEEFNLEMYGEDKFECDEMVYEDDIDYRDEDPDYDMWDGGYWEDDGRWDDDPSPYNGE